MNFLFASTQKVSSRDLLIVVLPAQYVGRVSKQAQTWLLLLCFRFRYNRDQMNWPASKRYSKSSPEQL